jgi:hypothetical protein
MAGGATPATTESETHYTELAEGVPFIRVQNLSTTGKLNLEDCKRITRSTHEKLLERSRLSGGELLVKITGVGRMAVASVVPDGFEGNINQHIAALWTENAKTSEALAAYLNLDFVERLASRRATGGTRPALDYPALLSLPVVFDERIPKLVHAAVKRSDEQFSKASSLLASVDELLLAEFGITPKPAPPNAVKNRIFRRAFSAVTGKRFDPVANQPKRFAIESAVTSGKYPAQSLHTLVTIRKDIVDFIKPGVRYVGLENIDGATGDLIETGEKESVSSALNFSPGQILFPKLRPYLNKTHRAAISGLCSTEFYVFDIHGITAEFLAEFLRSQATVAVTSLLMTGNTLPRLQLADIEQLQIPVPPVPVQEKIAAEIKKVRLAAHAMRRQAAAELAAAKKEIEAMILGNV